MGTLRLSNTSSRLLVYFLVRMWHASPGRRDIVRLQTSCGNTRAQLAPSLHFIVLLDCRSLLGLLFAEAREYVTFLEFFHCPKTHKEGLTFSGGKFGYNPSSKLKLKSVEEFKRFFFGFRFAGY